jgi:hypothetical protein
MNRYALLELGGNGAFDSISIVIDGPRESS